MAFLPPSVNVYWLSGVEVSYYGLYDSSVVCNCMHGMEHRRSFGFPMENSTEFHSQELFSRDLSLEPIQKNLAGDLIMEEFYAVVHTVLRNPFKHSSMLWCISQVHSSVLSTHPRSNHVPLVRGDSLKLHQGKFWLAIGNNFFLHRAVMQAQLHR